MHTPSRYSFRSAPARLAGCAATLVLVFAGAAVAGGALDVDRGSPPMGEMEADPVRGLAISDHGLTLEPAYDGRTLRLRIADRRGATVRDFDVEHTKRMHVIVVRRDLTGFQHLHPAQAADGTWSVSLRLRDPGSYHVFADFSVGGEARTPAGDLQVPGTFRPRALPDPVTSVQTDGLTVRREGLRFTVLRDGRPVPLDDYLGAKGHLVALREGDLAFLHVHPDARSLRFETEFPSAGRYRLFLQFSVDGQVHTAAFTEEVPR